MERFWKKKTIVSFLLSLLVVMLHNYAVIQFVGDNLDDHSSLWLKAAILCRSFFLSLGSIAVPLFFLISGALLFRNISKENIRNKVNKRVKSVLIPYVLWNFIWMIFEIICSYTPLHKFFRTRSLFLLTTQNVINSVLFAETNGVFWFLKILILYILFTRFFYLITKNKTASFAFLIFFIFIQALVCDDIQQNIIISSSLEEFLVNIPYYLAGVIIGRYYFDIFSKKYSRKTVFISMTIFVIFLILKFLDEQQIIELSDFICESLIFVGIICFWISADSLIDKIETSDFMHSSFFIYATHANIIAMFSRILYLFTGGVYFMAIPNYFFSFVLTILAIMIIEKIMSKYFPEIYNVLNGGR